MSGEAQAEQPSEALLDTQSDSHHIDGGDADAAATDGGLVEEILEGVLIEPEVREKLGHKIEMVIGQVQSPVPPPFMLRDYASVLPDAPERLFRMAEAQSTHRQDLERRVVRGNERRASTGQFMAFGLALAFLAGAIWLINGGHPIAGSFLGTIDLVALVSVFLFARDEQAKTAVTNRQATEPPSSDPVS